MLKQNVRILLLRTAITSVYSGIYAVIFNLYILQMGFKTDFLGLVLSVSLLASSFCSIPAGILCDRYDRKKILIVTSLLSILATAPVFISDSPSVLLVFSAIGGMCGSVVGVCLTPMIVECSEGGCSLKALSFNSALGWAASIVGSALGGTLPGIMQHFTPLAGMDGYRLTLVASLLLLALGWVPLFFLRDIPRKKPREATRKTKITVSPTTMKFGMISIFTGLGSGMIVPYFNVYFSKILGMGVMKTGWIFAVADVAMVVSFMMAPYLAAKFGKAMSTVLTQAASIPFLMAMALTSNFLLASGAYVARMSLMNLAGPTIAGLQMDLIDPGERGKALGIISTGYNLAVAGSTLAGGCLIAKGDIMLPFIFTCIAYAGASFLMFYFFRDDGKSGHESPGTKSASPA